jgi:hypothetical protein
MKYIKMFENFEVKKPQPKLEIFERLIKKRKTIVVSIDSNGMGLQMFPITDALRNLGVDYVEWTRPSDINNKKPKNNQYVVIDYESIENYDENYQEAIDEIVQLIKNGMPSIIAMDISSDTKISTAILARASFVGFENY